MSSEIDPGQSPTIPAHNRKQENWWERIDLASTTVTLALTTVIFMVGWSYVANWYAYFGIGADQISIVLQQVFIYSVKPVAMALGYGIIACAIYIFVRTAWLRRQFDFETNDWFYVILVWILLLIYGQSNNYNDVPEVEALANENRYVGFFLIALVVSLVVVLLLRKFGSFQSFLRAINPWRWIILALLAFAVFLSYSASMAILDARRGFKGLGGEIQQVFLVSRQPLMALHPVEIACAAEGCYYGPFGLILQNDLSFFLAIPNKKAPPKFPSKAGLYIVPRSDANGPYFVVPASQGVPSIPARRPP